MIETKLAVMRAAVRKKAPYWTAAIRGFIYHELPGLGTVGLTKGLVFIYDPEYVRKQTAEHLEADLAHELLHAKFKHHERGERIVQRNQHRWNLAADYAINPILEDCDWKLAHDAVFPEQKGFRRGLTANAYYDLLLEQEKEEEAKQQQQAKGGSPKEDKQEGSAGGGKSKSKKPEPSDKAAKSPKSAADKGEGEGGEGDGDPGESPGGGGSSKEGQQPKQSAVGKGCCGGAAGNKIDPRMEDEIDAEHGRSEVDRKRIFNQVAKDIQTFAQNRGHVPGAFQQWAEAATEPSVIRWEDELGDILRDCSGRAKSGSEDYSLRRPSKHSYLRGILRPGVVDYTPEVMFVLDTSGSMNEEHLRAGMREAAAILLALNIDEVDFAQVDTHLCKAVERKPLHYFLGKVEFFGRGGTDFRPAFEEAEKRNPRPDLLVYFTDGEGPAPDNAPAGIQTVWCLVPSHSYRYERKPPATWGHSVVMKNKKAA